MAKRDSVPTSEPTLEQMREAATQAVERASLRTVAREAGVTRGALHLLVRGSTPQRRTWEKLLAWYRGLTAPTGDTAYRTVPVQILREWLVDRLQREEYRAVAADLGLHHSVVEAFIKRVEKPTMRTRRAIALRYLADQPVTPPTLPSPGP